MRHVEFWTTPTRHMQPARAPLEPGIGGLSPAWGHGGGAHIMGRHLAWSGRRPAHAHGRGHSMARALDGRGGEGLGAGGLPKSGV
jgi:hypothetical protein